MRFVFLLLVCLSSAYGQAFSVSEIVPPSYTAAERDKIDEKLADIDAVLAEPAPAEVLDP